MIYSIIYISKYITHLTCSYVFFYHFHLVDVEINRGYAYLFIYYFLQSSSFYVFGAV
jgi:hypothetical protein